MNKKRITLAAVAGVSVLGLTTAGASTLNLASPGAYFAGIAQQSDKTTTSCVSGSMEVSLPIDDDTVSSAKLLQQYLQGCAGQEVQVVLYKGANAVAASEVERVVANANDVVLDFAGPVDVQDFNRYRVTVGSEIL